MSAQDRSEIALLQARQECAAEAWRLWGRRRAAPTCHRYQRALEWLECRRPDAAGYVALGAEVSP